MNKFNSGLRAAVIGMANIYLSIAFSLLRRVNIHVRAGERDTLKFRAAQCDRQFRIIVTEFNIDTMKYSESLKRGQLVSFVPQLAARWKGEEH